MARYARADVVSGEERSGQGPGSLRFSRRQYFDGIKKATRVETKHDGQRLLLAEVTNFKLLDAPEAGAFDRPQ